MGVFTRDLYVKQSDIRVRPERDSDLPFLRSLYATTRMDVASSNLPQRQKQEFIESQFRAQWQSYHTNYVNAEFLIVEKKHKPIGKLYVSRMPKETRVIDIIIAPEHRNKGIGTGLLRAMQTEAKLAGACVTLHAEKMGNMSGYYLQLGFEIVAEKEAHYLMKWASGSSILVT